MSGPTSAFVEILVEQGVDGLEREGVWQCFNCDTIFIDSEVVIKKEVPCCFDCGMPEDGMAVWGRTDIEEYLSTNHADFVKEYWNEH